MAIIGIDLGTTYSVMAYLDQTGQPKIIPNADGENTTPSVVAFLGDEVLVGMEAKEYQQDGSGNIASFFKRSMGDPYFELEFNGKVYNTIDMSAEVLRKLKNDAEAFLNEKVTKAVITVPAYFNNVQREATIAAGKKVGLEVLGILNEPTAASIAYGLRATGSGKHVLVYDLGGGTFDVTISKIEADSITVLSTEGDHNLGGKDFDDLLADYVNNLFMDEHGIDLFDEEGSLNTLLVTVEEVKQKLTSLQRTTVDILFDRKRGKYEVTRENFEDLSTFLLERAWSLVDLALENAGLTVKDLDEVILVGGSTRMPMIASYVQRQTNILPKSTINVDEVVAIGAALQANILESQKQKVQPRFALGPAKKVDDVMSHSLGLVAVNEDATKYINSIMIPKNKTIPAVTTKTYALNTRRNRENTWDVYITQGESERPMDCTILGKYTVRNIPYTTEQPTKLSMTFGYDSNGVMQIEAKEKSTQQKLEIQVEKAIGDLDWLAKTPDLTEEMEPVNVILAIDTSGSMSGSPIDEAMKAANQFIAKLDESIFSIGLLAFADEVELIEEPTANKAALSKKVRSLNSYVKTGTLGYGTNSEPLGELYKYLSKQDGKHIVLLLTDGLWFSAEEEIVHSKKLNQLGVDIIAVGTSEADEDFLKEIATSDENALFVDLSELVQSFTKIAQVVTETYKLTSR